MSSSIPLNVLPALAALHAADYQRVHLRDNASAPRQHPPFITISRQAGAGGRSFARQLVTRLNQTDSAQLPWTLWDNELVERVASENHLRPAAVAALEDNPPSWLEQALASLASGSGERNDELAVYHRVAVTIRALAELGRVVIVGRGGAFITRDIPGGVHLRLVAPEDHRIAAIATSMNLAPDAAAQWMRHTDRNREAFYRRHWRDRPLTPENFTATFNTAATRLEQLVDSTLCLIPAAVSTDKPQPQLFEKEPQPQPANAQK
jgi:hypothetical protein